MRAYTRQRMSFQPRAGISDGVSANRPRSASNPAFLRAGSAVANRCRRNPSSNSAAVIAVTQIGMRSTEWSALTMPGLRRLFSFVRLLGHRRRRGRALVRRLRKLGSAGQVFLLGLLLCLAIGMLGDSLRLFVLLRRERLRALLELIAGLAHQLVFGSRRRQRRAERRAQGKSESSQDQRLLLAEVQETPARVRGGLRHGLRALP